jgi:hypothetical protein
MASNPIDVSDRNAILAGLRMLQAWKEGRVTSTETDHDAAIELIETEAGECEALGVEAIDDLCERINCGDVTISDTGEAE